jgi:hypothetical protein
MKADLGIPALLEIAVASAGMAAVALFVIRRSTDQDAIARTRAQAEAHLLECRLFLDEPLQILRSQRALLLENIRMMRQLLRPLLILAIPTALVMWQLDALYGRAPLRVGEAAVVSTDSRESSIMTSGSVVVETGPHYIKATKETSWRIRPSRAISGFVRVGSVNRRIVAGSGIAYLPEPLPGSHRIDITYPGATVLGLPWLAWFLALSTIAAFLLRRPMRVKL